MSWLDDQPTALVLLGLVVVSLGIAIALTHLAERVFEAEARSRTSTSVTTAVGVVAGLYAVLAAFVIVNEWQAFNDAQATISSESAGLADALANATVLSDPGRSQIQHALFAYDPDHPDRRRPRRLPLVNASPPDALSESRLREPAVIGVV